MFLLACIHVVCVPWVCVMSMQWAGNATGIADCCELQHGCWELISGPRQEQPVLFTTGHFSVPFCLIFILQMLNTHSPPKIGAWRKLSAL